MGDVVRWLLVLEVFGLAALPLAARAFRNLPDRGYAFARPLGVLVVAVLLWLGATFGVWSNSAATVVVLTVVVGVVGWLGMSGAVAEVRNVWKYRRPHIVAVEVLFVVAFLAWVFVRAHMPNIEATEKPMEFGFLNGILRSQRFPPADPWLSGNSISYYYLGYVVVAVLTEFSGVDPAVAFNLAIATLFALTVAGAFALGHALVDGSRAGALANRSTIAVQDENVPHTSADERAGWIAGGITAGFVAILGNLEGGLELLHAHGVGSTAFWQSLAIWHLDHPYLSDRWYPTEGQDNWWWFRASRVILDYPNGTPPPDGYNTITEFPFFSFLLGDLHPHVLALPFAFVCLGFAVSFLREPTAFSLERPRDVAFDIGFIVLLFGSMFLLNAWDILTYLFVLVCAFAVRQYLARPRFDLRWVRGTATFGLAALVGSILVYLPFYVTFRSQATGLLGIVRLHSHLDYFLLYWGPFIFLSASLVVGDLILGSKRGDVRGAAGPAWTRSPVTLVAVAALAAGALVVNAPALALIVPIGFGALVLVVRRLANEAEPEVLEATALETTSKSISPRDGAELPGEPAGIAGGAPIRSGSIDHVYVLVLLFVAMLLLLGTELVFIQDSFNSRMNTVFKLYFQSWELLAVVGGYTVYYLGRAAFSRSPDRRLAASNGSEAMSRFGVPVLARLAGTAWLAIVALLVVAAGVYAPASLFSRSDGFASELNLNGLSYFERFQSDDAAGISWLNHNVTGSPTIVEATGGSYSAFGEVAWMTGLPTLLGWDFHEMQWHGSPIIPVVDERKRDIDTIYRATDVKTTQDLLKKYDATFVYVGPLERQTYAQSQAGLTKFSQFMDVVYRNPGVTIYRVRGTN